MGQRIEKLKEAIRPQEYPLCMERTRLFTEAFQEAEGDPQVIRMAKAVANVLDKITIFIEDGELIVGNTASKPMGFEVEPGSVGWSADELNGLREAGWTINEEDVKRLEFVNEYWRTQTAAYRQGQIWDEERLWPYRQSGVVPPPSIKREEGWGASARSGMGLGHAGLVVVDYEKVLNSGLNKIIEEAKEELRNTRFTSTDSVSKVYFLKAVIIAHKAIIRFANRFAVLAAELMLKEADITRKKELQRIVATCKWVPANPARDFYEAMQSFWFVLLMLTPSGVTGLGRFDQFMYPFYKKDIEEGRITDDEALEFLQCLRIKDMQLHSTFAQLQREKQAGLSKWHNMVIGGITAGGEDATNDLSYLILEAAKRCQTPHHTITLRVHDGTPETLILKALEVVKTGIGMPAFIGDKSYIEYLLNQGVPIREARGYALGGCLEAVIPAKSVNFLANLFIVPLVFDYFLHNGVEPRTGRQLGPKTGDLESFESFDDLMSAFKKQLAYFISMHIECNNIELTVWNDLFPNPIASSLMVDGIKEGKNIMGRKFPLLDQGLALCPVGMINVADSMAAVKKLVFDEKTVTMKDLKAALEANWQGNGYEVMRQMFLAAPKYGNDDDYVDSIARDLYQFWADTVVTLDSWVGGKVKPAGVSISAHQPGGKLTGATPDGRYAGEILADGTISAAQGRDTNGPTALIRSAMKIDQVPYQSTLLNMKFHPSTLNSTEALMKLSNLIKTYFRLGGKHIQFNIVSKKTLLDAQRHPEKHRDLIVRVAGYSAYFVQLTKIIQDEIIGRMEYEQM